MGSNIFFLPTTAVAFVVTTVVGKFFLALWQQITWSGNRVMGGGGLERIVACGYRRGNGQSCNRGWMFGWQGRYARRRSGTAGNYPLPAVGLGEPDLRVPDCDQFDKKCTWGHARVTWKGFRALTWKTAENRTCESGAGRKIVPGGFYSVVRKAGGKSYL